MPMEHVCVNFSLAMSLQSNPALSIAHIAFKMHLQSLLPVMSSLIPILFTQAAVQGGSRKTGFNEEEDAELDVDPLIKLAKAAATAAAASAVPTGGSHEADIPPSSSIPTDEFAGGSDIPAGATTGPSTVSPSSTIVPTPSYVPDGSGTTPESPSSPVRDARKGKGVAVDEPTPTQDKTFKQLEEARLGWEAAKRLQAQELADFEKQRVESLIKDANLV
ncbi:hypothetical protein Tco_0003404 [Tanacetum coccineum]